VRLRFQVQGRPPQPRQDETQRRLRKEEKDEDRLPRADGNDAQQARQQIMRLADDLSLYIKL
jgi:hypothetical protein